MGGLAKQVCVFEGSYDMNGISPTQIVGGKRGKETPVATEAAPTVAMPSKVSTTMKKRGDEDLDSKYLRKAE